MGQRGQNWREMTCWAREHGPMKIHPFEPPTASGLTQSRFKQVSSVTLSTSGDSHNIQVLMRATVLLGLLLVAASPLGQAFVVLGVGAPVGSAGSANIGPSSSGLLVVPLRGGVAASRMMTEGPPPGGNVLYCKQGPAAGSLGDCPFTHKAHLALRAKGFSPTLAMIDMTNKPTWFLDINPDGTAPAYVKESGEVITQSDDIVAFADANGSGPQLLGKPGSEELWEVAKQIFPGAYPRMHAHCTRSG